MSEFEDRLNAILSSPKDMEKIMSLAKEIGGGGAPPTPDQDCGDLPGGIDPKIFIAVKNILGEYSAKENSKAELVRSIKPFLRQERRRDLDRAVEIAKMAGIARIALREFGRGGGNA